MFLNFVTDVTAQRHQKLPLPACIGGSGSSGDYRAVTVTAKQVHQETGLHECDLLPGDGNRVPVMAGNHFEIKKKFCPKSDIFQAVTEVQASFVFLARAEPPESSVPKRLRPTVVIV